MESVTTTTTTEEVNSPPPAPVAEQKELRLVDIPINDENTALNVMVGFLSVAHKRGVFTIDESAKIWECISKFQTTRP
jgi:glutathione synthase/RimK-type ligase-like ATP-grasp enzyme